jgi:hypothetical protein
MKNLNTDQEKCCYYVCSPLRFFPRLLSLVKSNVWVLVLECLFLCQEHRQPVGKPVRKYLLEQRNTCYSYPRLKQERELKPLTRNEVCHTSTLSNDLEDLNSNSNYGFELLNPSQHSRLWIRQIVTSSPRAGPRTLACYSFYVKSNKN